jgi:hypothetical protein
MEIPHKMWGQHKNPFDETKSDFYNISPGSVLNTAGAMRKNKKPDVRVLVRLFRFLPLFCTVGCAKHGEEN